jgi:hypothetical protein
MTLMVLALLVYLSVFSAIGVVLDARKPGGLLAASGLALTVLALVGWPENRQSGRRRVVVLVAVVLSLLVTGLFVKLLFLTIDEQKVLFGHDEILLSGTLYLPRTAGPVPAVVIVHGAGSGLRKEPAF